MGSMSNRRSTWEDHFKPEHILWFKAWGRMDRELHLEEVHELGAGNASGMTTDELREWHVIYHMSDQNNAEEVADA